MRRAESRIMSTHLTSATVRIAIARARAALQQVGTEPVEKTIWGSPAGKKRLAKRLVALLPPHRVYCEPFAGSAAVLFAKEPAEIEAINDADLEIADAYRTIQKLTPADIERLRGMTWTGDEQTFKRLFDSSPGDDIERLHRLLYVSHFSYGRLRSRSFSPAAQGVEAKTISRIESFAPRLKGVKVHGEDYQGVIERYDSPDTVFFLDPPYPGYNVDVGESSFDERRFFDLLTSIKGRWLLTYGIRGELPKLLADSDFFVKRIRTPRTIRAMRGVGGSSVLTQILAANYEIVEKAEDGSAWLEDWAPRDDRAASEHEDAEVEKRQAFGTFGGSFHYAKRLVPMLPAHEVYVEPFAGAAALLYAKEPSGKEVIADLDEDVVFLHRSIKAMDDEKIAELRERFTWTCTKESFQAARAMDPADDLARFYKSVFVRTHARDCRPDGTHPARNHLGSTTDPAKYLKSAERLREVTILRQDYRKTIARYDAPETFFFIDPPYPGEWFDREAVINLDEFIDTLSTIKGKFIAVLNSSPENVAAFKKVGHVFRLKVREASGRGGVKQAMRLFCCNFAIRKCDIAELVAKRESDVIAKTTQLIKGADPTDERYVLGVVLEPETVDAQGDIYSAEEVRSAAHRFLEDFGGLGVQHQYRVNDRVKVLENYLAPADFRLGDIDIRKGTWLMAVRILADELWQQVKDGDLTGFSIGGSARRLPAHINVETEIE